MCHECARFVAVLALLGAARRPARRAKRDNFKKKMIKSYVSIQFFDVIFCIAAKYVLYSSLRSSLVRTSCELRANRFAVQCPLRGLVRTNRCAVRTARIFRGDVFLYRATLNEKTLLSQQMLLRTVPPRARQT